MSLELESPLLFERLGLMLDVSRNRVPKITTLKALINVLSTLGYNELQLYTEHSFAYKKHSVVWKEASPYTAEDISEIGDYCQQRGIDLVPNQNSFGHMERWLRHEPYKHLAESPDGFEHPIAGWRDFGSTLYPCEESAQFMDTLYAELLPNFTSDQFHIGGDEPWELGQGRSKQRVAQEGKHTVYLEFLNTLLAQAISHGKRPQFWADIVLERPELVSQLPRNITPVIWGYDADSAYSEQCPIVAKAGFENNYYVAPGAGNWNSFAYRHDVAATNIQLAAKEGVAHKARGMLLTAWGDNGHHQPWPTIFPGILLAAAAARGQEIQSEDLAALIDAFFYSELPKGNGATLCELGRIDSLLAQPAPPSSFIHKAFFARETELAELLKLPQKETLQTSLEAIEAIQPEGLDSQIQLSIDLNRASLERCLNLPQTLASEALLDSFKARWMEVSRTSNIQESLNLMTQ